MLDGVLKYTLQTYLGHWLSNANKWNVHLGCLCVFSIYPLLDSKLIELQKAMREW